MLRVVVLLLVLLPLAAAASWVEDSWDVMGTRASVQLWHDDEGEGQRLIAAVRAEFERLNALLSPWIADSELARLNRVAHQQPVKVSAEFYALLEASQHYTILTDGAFDITFATTGHLYDLRKGERPDDDTLARHLDESGMNNVQLLPEQHVALAHEKTRIDLGGIAKGHAIDQAVALLVEGHVQHAWVSLGGDSRVIGDHRDRLWHIGIRHPRTESDVAITLPVADVAVSTSGDYERFYMDGDERVHHILSPATGKPVGELASVTILAPTSLVADALSTSVFVLGPEKGLALVEAMDDVSAILIRLDGEVIYSSDLFDAE